MASAAGPLGSKGSSATRDPYFIAAPPVIEIEYGSKKIG